MANHEHLAILENGVEAWNKFIDDEQRIHSCLGQRIWSESAYLDLREARLSNANLQGIRLAGADLHRSQLDRAVLADASLYGADLSCADLRGADLSRANLGKLTLVFDDGFEDFQDTDLSGANLSGANLVMADLCDAFLADTNLTGADLEGAQLNRTHFEETVFGDTNLKGTFRLDRSYLTKPCTIDIRTIAKSWPLPLTFLQGCGLPDSFIEWIGSTLQAGPIRFHSCFISYSSLDEDFAKSLYASLQNNGVRCWFAPHDVKGGRKLHEQIDQAIQIHDRLLLVLSKHSMASNWVKTEIADARKRETNEGKRVLFPIRLVDFEDIKRWSLFDADTGIDSAREIREYFIPDFSDWTDEESYKKAFERLLRDLKAESDKG